MKNIKIFIGSFFLSLFILLSQNASSQSTVESLRSGDWNDPTLWNTGVLPQLGDTVLIGAGEVVTANISSSVAGITVQEGGELRFSPTQSVAISSTANVVVNGKFVAKPNNAAIVHTLKFLGIDETKFVGGGMSVIPQDVGLWVMGSGQLDIAGTEKTAWTRLAGSVPFFATQITLIAPPVGWRVGDVISIVPTEPITKSKWSFTSFDVRTITEINGAVVTLDSAVSRPRPINIDPITGAIHTGEVLNLTRNVRIGGTGDGNQLPSRNGRSHIFVQSDQPQSILFLEISHTTPRRTNADGFTSAVLGRYGLHFHMTGDGSRGSLVEGVVVRDAGGHAFVVHGANGVTLLNTITHNTFDDAYWWDNPTCPTCTGNDPADLLIDGAVAALVRTDPPFRGFRLTGFVMGAGVNLTIKNSVAVGIQGNAESAGFAWPEALSHGVWSFCENNIAHNNARNGLFVWQNDQLPHIICSFTAYGNGNAGIDHGAYTNVYQYKNISVFGNTVDFVSRALTNGATREDGYGMAIEELRAPGTFMILEHNVASGIPNLVKDCVIGNILIDESSKPVAGKYDFVNCQKPNGAGIQSSDFVIYYARTGSIWRVQNRDGTAFQMTKTSITPIEPFYILPLSPLAQQVKDILDANPNVRQELIDAGIIN